MYTLMYAYVCSFDRSGCSGILSQKSGLVGLIGHCMLSFNFSCRRDIDKNVTFNLIVFLVFRWGASLCVERATRCGRGEFNQLGHLLPQWNPIMWNTTSWLFCHAGQVILWGWQSGRMHVCMTSCTELWCHFAQQSSKKPAIREEILDFEVWKKALFIWASHEGLPAHTKCDTAKQAQPNVDLTELYG